MEAIFVGYYWEIWSLSRSWTSGCKTPRTTMDDRFNQDELLVARNQEQHEELCPRIL